MPLIVKRNVTLRLEHPNIRGSRTGKSIKQKYCCTGYLSFVIILCFLNTFLFYTMVLMPLEKNRRKVFQLIMIKASVKQSIWPSSFEKISIMCITLVALRNLCCCLEHLISETALSYDIIIALFPFGGYIIHMFLIHFYKAEL